MSINHPSTDRPPMSWFRSQAHQHLDTWNRAAHLLIAGVLMSTATFVPAWLAQLAGRLHGGEQMADLANLPSMLALRPISYILAVLLPLIGLPILFNRAHRLADHLARIWEPGR